MRGFLLQPFHVQHTRNTQHTWHKARSNYAVGRAQHTGKHTCFKNASPETQSAQKKQVTSTQMAQPMNAQVCMRCNVLAHAHKKDPSLTLSTITSCFLPQKKLTRWGWSFWFCRHITGKHQSGLYKSKNIAFEQENVRPTKSKHPTHFCWVLGHPVLLQNPNHIQPPAIHKH